MQRRAGLITVDNTGWRCAGAKLSQPHVAQQQNMRRHVAGALSHSPARTASWIELNLGQGRDSECTHAAAPSRVGVASAARARARVRNSYYSSIYSNTIQRRSLTAAHYALAITAPVTCQMGTAETSKLSRNSQIPLHESVF